MAMALVPPTTSKNGQEKAARIPPLAIYPENRSPPEIHAAHDRRRLVSGATV